MKKCGIFFRLVTKISILLDLKAPKEKTGQGGQAVLGVVLQIQKAFMP